MAKRMKEENWRDNFCLWRWDCESTSQQKKKQQSSGETKRMNKKIDSKRNKQRVNGWQCSKKKYRDAKEERKWQRLYLVFSFAERLIDDVDMLLWSPDHLPSCLCLPSSVFVLLPAPWFRQTKSFDLFYLWLNTHRQTDRQTDRQEEQRGRYWTSNVM